MGQFFHFSLPLNRADDNAHRCRRQRLLQEQRSRPRPESMRPERPRWFECREHEGDFGGASSPHDRHDACRSRRDALSSSGSSDPVPRLINLIVSCCRLSPASYLPRFSPRPSSKHLRNFAFSHHASSYSPKHLRESCVVLVLIGLAPCAPPHPSRNPAQSESTFVAVTGMCVRNARRMFRVRSPMRTGVARGSASPPRSRSCDQWPTLRRQPHHDPYDGG